MKPHSSLPNTNEAINVDSHDSIQDADHIVRSGRGRKPSSPVWESFTIDTDTETPRARGKQCGRSYAYNKQTTADILNHLKTLKSSYEEMASCKICEARGQGGIDGADSIVFTWVSQTAFKDRLVRLEVKQDGSFALIKCLESKELVKILNPRAILL